MISAAVLIVLFNAVTVISVVAFNVVTVISDVTLNAVDAISLAVSTLLCLVILRWVWWSTWSVWWDVDCW